MNENSYSSTDLLKSGSSATVTRFWTCSLSASSNENGTCGSGGIVGGRKDEMTAIDGFESREIRRSDESLRTRTTDEHLFESWSCSASNTCGGDDSWVATQVSSELDGDGFRLIGGQGDATVGFSTGDVPPGSFPDG